MTCRPDHPAKHDDFAEGNLVSLKHGAYSERAIAERAEQVHATLLDQAPWCAEERYAPALLRYLRACAREELAHAAVMASSKLSPRLMECATAAARLSWYMSDQLGLTPMGHQQLKVLVADAATAEASIARLAETGRTIREARAVAEGKGRVGADAPVGLALAAPVPQPRGNTGRITRVDQGDGNAPEPSS